MKISAPFPRQCEVLRNSVGLHALSPQEKLNQDILSWGYCGVFHRQIMTIKDNIAGH